MHHAGEAMGCASRTHSPSRRSLRCRESARDLWPGDRGFSAPWGIRAGTSGSGGGSRAGMKPAGVQGAHIPSDQSWVRVACPSRAKICRWTARRTGWRFVILCPTSEARRVSTHQGWLRKAGSGTRSIMRCP